MAHNHLNTHLRKLDTRNPLLVVPPQPVAPLSDVTVEVDNEVAERLVGFLVSLPDASGTFSLDVFGTPLDPSLVDHHDLVRLRGYVNANNVSDNAWHTLPVMTQADLVQDGSVISGSTRFIAYRFVEPMPHYTIRIQFSGWTTGNVGVWML